MVCKGHRIAHAHPLTECDSLFCVDTSELQMAQLSDKEITALHKWLNLNSENFSERQFWHMSDLITKYFSAFSINKEIGHVRVDPIHINFVNEVPVRLLPYKKQLQQIVKL